MNNGNKPGCAPAQEAHTGPIGGPELANKFFSMLAKNAALCFYPTVYPPEKSRAEEYRLSFLHIDDIYLRCFYYGLITRAKALRSESIRRENSFRSVTRYADRQISDRFDNILKTYRTERMMTDHRNYLLGSDIYSIFDDLYASAARLKYGAAFSSIFWFPYCFKPYCFVIKLPDLQRILYLNHREKVTHSPTPYRYELTARRIDGMNRSIRSRRTRSRRTLAVFS